MAATLVLVVNDHLLKHRWGNTLTGKLSDVAGVYLFPLLVLAVVGLATRRWRPDLIDRSSVAALALAGTAMGFMAVKLLHPVGDAYEVTVGWLRWVAQLGRSTYHPIVVVRDLSDLVVLPVLAGSYRVISRSTQPDRHQRAGES
jgi:hypothetical protein